MIYVRMTSQGPQVWTAPSFTTGSSEPAYATADKALVNVGNSAVIPISTGVPILPTQSAHITARPRETYNCKRLIISNAGTAGGAADWIVNDIKIDGVSQFLKPGNISGDMFATNADRDTIDALNALVQFTSAQPEMAVDVIVTYVGFNKRGCPFFASIVEGSVRRFW